MRMGMAFGAIALAALMASATLAQPGPGEQAYGALPEGELVQRCVDYVGNHYSTKRDARGDVEEIVSVEPTTKGWRIRGRLREEQASGLVHYPKFICRLNHQGRTRSLTIG